MFSADLEACSMARPRAVKPAIPRSPARCRAGLPRVRGSSELVLALVPSHRLTRAETFHLGENMPPSSQRFPHFGGETLLDHQFIWPPLMVEARTRQSRSQIL